MPSASLEVIHEPGYEVAITKRGITFLVDLPGVLPGNLHLTCRDHALLVWGHRCRPHGSIRHRWDGPFALELAIPTWTEPARLDQRFENGVLTVYVPQKRASIAR